MFDAVFRPSQFVRAPNAASRTSLRSRLGRIRSLSVVFLINVVLYATPLTLSGFGVAIETDAPAWFTPIATRVLGNPDAAWWLLAGIAQNSAFLTVISAATLFTGSMAQSPAHLEFENVSNPERIRNRVRDLLPRDTR